MASLSNTPAQYLKRHLARKSRVLLINPPVQERRYHWIRWNQPSDVLRLSTWIKKHCAGADVRLFDFMLPDEAGAVPKHKVKETWTGAENDAQLWHFGTPFESFERYLSSALTTDWCPDLILITSLTSYWHVPIEKLLIKICSLLGKQRRKQARIALYGNYPRFEAEHAGGQPDADVAFTESVDTRGCCPDFGLYLTASNRLPLFYALDAYDADVYAHLEHCLGLQGDYQRARSITRPPSITVAFFNEDICGQGSRLEDVVRFAQGHPKQLVVDGIAGVEPRSLSTERLRQLKMAGVRSLFVEHARLPGGGVDVEAYQPLLSFLKEEEHRKKSGADSRAWLDRGSVTGFIAMGLPDDDLDELVRATLTANSFFQAVILKPFGYSPVIDSASVDRRRDRWPQPCESSPQWFPYVGHGSQLSRDDYDNLIRWQNVLNKRVKGTTFDFLDEGTVARLVRETLVAESWKRHREVR